uniref:Uncharacterized protein n=1 Tax=Arundo donax TaxID=35708 RepID=A0A0A9H9J7_ARUDO
MTACPMQYNLLLILPVTQDFWFNCYPWIHFGNCICDISTAETYPACSYELR